MDDDTDVQDAETVQSAAPLEDVTSSPEQSETAEPEVKEGLKQSQAPKQPEVDPLTVLDSLELDPAVKENLKSGYLRQADYTRKTQELAKSRAILEEYTQVKPVLEFLNKNPELFNELYSKMQGQQQPTDGQEQIPDNPKEYADWLQAKIFQKLESERAQEADFQAAAKIDPRLDSDPEYGQMIAQMVAQDPDYRYRTITAEEATRRAVERFDKYISKQVYTAKASLSERAKAKRIGSVARSTPGSVSGGNQPRTIAEAAAMAEDELAS